jgi:release factor glutamine methyltransferase
MNFEQLLNHGAQQARLPRLEARILLSCVSGKSQEWLIAHGLDEVAAPDIEQFLALARRRADGEPIAYLAGQREFFGRRFRVTPAVLIPRPDTEVLAATALDLISGQAAPRLLDLGTGSGVLAVTLALERPDCDVLATDVSSAALEVAKQNAADLGAGRIVFRLGDWWQALDGVEPGFQLIVSNPPYIADGDPHLMQADLRFEPRQALSAGAAGDVDLRRIIAQAPAWLAPGGWLALEHGLEQGADCRHLMLAQRFQEVRTLCDLEHRERVTLGRTARVALRGAPGAWAADSSDNDPANLR